MLTDPVRDVETDERKRLILCDATTVYPMEEERSWLVNWITRDTVLTHRFLVTTPRFRSHSPTGKRYAY